MTSTAPMLATLGTVSDVEQGGEPSEWAFEMKWDGIRAIATIEDGGVRLATRNGIDVTAAYPDLADLPTHVHSGGGRAILDGEIVALNALARPDFGRLQRRLNLTSPREIAAAARDIPVHYLVFDILAVGGAAVTGLSYDERRTLLIETVESRDEVQVPPAFDGELDAAVEASRTLGLEGVIAKRRDSTYASGRRSRAWIKLKHHRTQEVVVGGWRPGNGRRASTVGSLLLGIPTASGLRYVGRVGTGFGERDLTELTSRLAKLERRTPPFDSVPRAVAADARWVKPTLVGEVEFAEWTATDILRQPSWRGWRPDKRPEQVVRES